MSFIVAIDGPAGSGKGTITKLVAKELGFITMDTGAMYRCVTVYFIDNKGVALSREQLLSKIWGYDFFGDDRTVDTHIKMLRNNLGEYRYLIKTVRGVGYKYETKD